MKMSKRLQGVVAIGLAVFTIMVLYSSSLRAQQANPAQAAGTLMPDGEIVPAAVIKPHAIFNEPPLGGTISGSTWVYYGTDLHTYRVSCTTGAFTVYLYSASGSQLTSLTLSQNASADVEAARIFVSTNGNGKYAQVD